MKYFGVFCNFGQVLASEVNHEYRMSKKGSALLTYKLTADGSLVSIRAKLNHRLLKGRFEFEVTLKMFLS